MTNPSSIGWCVGNLYGEGLNQLSNSSFGGRSRPVILGMVCLSRLFGPQIKPFSRIASPLTNRNYKFFFNLPWTQIGLADSASLAAPYTSAFSGQLLHDYNVHT